MICSRLSVIQAASINYFAPRWATCDQHVCMSVCLSASISHKKLSYRRGTRATRYISTFVVCLRAMGVIKVFQTAKSDLQGHW